MTKTKSKKRTLILSGIVIIICIAIGIFTWFNCCASSKIQADELKIDLLLKNDNNDWNSIKNSNKAVFDYANQQSDYTDVKIFKIVNNDSSSIKWMAKFISDSELTTLADVIDVYVTTSYKDISANTKNFTTWNKVGTVRDFVNTIKTTANGNLASSGKTNNSAYLGIAFKMKENTDKKYHGMSLGAFDIQIIATEFAYEDSNSASEFTPISNIDEFKTALANKSENIILTKDIIVKDTFTIEYNVNIYGSGKNICRTDTTDSNTFTGAIFTVKADSALTLENIIIDGGAIWEGEVNKTLARGTVNKGVVATGAIITTEGNGAVTLNKGAILQNNDGANAVSLSSRTGSKLIINGGEIVNNSSETGAIFGGGEITLNSGEICNNYGKNGGAIHIVPNVGNVLTMNGGEISHNYSEENGGAIGASDTYSKNIYQLSGGEIAHNYSKTVGGAIYVGNHETLKISGTLKIHNNNCADGLGSAIYFHKRASFVMSGGEIYKNGDNSNTLLLLNNDTSIIGGKIVDNFGYNGTSNITWGNAELDGVITFNLYNSINTVYLESKFNTLKFAVNDASDNFKSFNFKPAKDYVYTKGDEAKLVCMNDGYETYWNETTKTFCLKAK